MAHLAIFNAFLHLTVIVLLLQDVVEGGAYLRVKFTSFNSRGRDWGYDKCDGIWSSCDPWFTSVQLVTSLGTHYNAKGSNDYGNNNAFSFGPTISGNIPNPFTGSKLSSWPGYFYLKVTVYDKDGGLLGNSDKLDVYNKYLSGTRKTSTSYWNSVTIYGTRPGGTSKQSVLSIQWQAYCESRYYGTKCNVYCSATSKYTCNTSTGAKICKTNYYGSTCSVYCAATTKYTCSSSGSKICKSYYYGSSCATYCRAYSSSTYTCNTATGANICKANYFGSSCSVYCQATSKYSCSSSGSKLCKAGYYGTTCGTYCKAYSTSTYTCNYKTGAKVCKTGYYGSSCSVYCLASSSSKYTCSSTGSKVCKQYYYGSNCGTYCSTTTKYTCSSSGVKLCRTNYYGSTCAVYCAPTTKYTCSSAGSKVCRTGYFGSLCATYCVASTTSRYTCNTKTGAKICKAGWTSTNCDTSINECAASPCKNGGTCQDGHLSYKCVCHPHFKPDTDCGTWDGPKDPRSLTISAQTANSVSLTWLQPDQAQTIDGYWYSFEDVFARTKKAFKVAASTTSVSMSSLVPARQYKMTLWAFYMAYDGSRKLLSENLEKSFFQLPSPVTLLNVRERKTTDFKVQWTNPTHRIEGSTIAVYKKGTLLPLIKKDVQTDSTSVAGLLPGEQYMVRVKTYIFDTLNGNARVYSEDTNMTVTTVPNPLQSPTVVSRTSSSAEVTWKAPNQGAPVDGYIISYSNMLNVAKQVEVKDIRHMFDGLTPAYEYTLKMGAYTLDVSKSKVVSEAIGFKFKTAPLAPSNLAISRITTTSFALQWTPPTQITKPAGYSISVAKLGALSKPQIIDVTTLDTVISGLTPGAKYTAEVKTFILAQNSDKLYSTGVAIEDVVVPLPPTGVKVTSTTTNKISLSWTAGSGSVQDDYVIKSTSLISSTVQTSVSGTTGVISNLVPGRKYSFSVQATSFGKVSAISTAITDSTDPSPVSSLTIEQDPSLLNKVKLTWAPGPGDRESFKIQYGSTTLDNISKSETTKTISGLVHGDTYTFKLFTVSADKKLSAAVSKVYKTKDYPVVSNFKVSSTTNSSATVTWTKVTGMDTFINSLSVTDKASGSVVQTSIASETVTSKTFSGLLPGKAYIFSIAVTKTGATRKGNAVIVKSHTNPLQPTNLAVSTSSATTTDQVALTWNAGTGSVQDEYTVFFTPADGSASPATITSVTTSVTISSLTPGENYDFVVRASSGGKESGDSNVLKESTLPSPVAQFDVQRHFKYLDGADLAWTPGAGNMKYVIISYGSSKLTINDPAVFNKKITDLTMGQTYKFGIQVVSEYGKVSSKVEKNLIVPAVPLVTSLTVSSTTTTSATLQWTPISGIEGHNYTITVTDTTANSASRTLTAAESDTTDTLSGLLPGRTYTFTIAVTKGGETGSQTTVSNNTYPLPPSNLQVSTSVATTTTSVSLTWVSGSGSTQDKFIVTVTPTDGSSVAKTVAATTTSVTVSSLTPGKKYEFVVKAESSGKSSGISNKLTENTVPSAVTSFTVTQGSYLDTVVLSWAPGIGQLNSFTITYSGKTLPNIPSSDTTKTITGLSMANAYTFGILAVSYGTSSIKVTKDYTTQALPTVQALKVTAATTSSITVTWTGVTSLNGFTYSINCTNTAANSIPKMMSAIAASQTSQTISGLQAGHSYNVHIGVVKGSTGPLSSLVNNTVPLAPTNVKVSTTSPTTTNQVTLTWSPGSGSKQDGYIVTVSAIDGSTASFQIAAATSPGVITNLVPGKMYKFVVNAESVGRKSVESVAVFESTLPAAVASLTVTQDTHTDEVIVQWSHGPGNINEYTLTYGTKTVANIAASETSKKIGNLELKKKYSFGITASSFSKVGQKVMKDYETKAFPLVSGLVSTSVITTAVTLSWTAVTSLANFTYTVRFTDTASSSAQTISSIGSSETSKVISGLVPGGKYVFTIAVHKGGATGGTVSTEESTYPLPPTGLVVSTSTSTTTNQVSLTWTAGSGSTQSSYIISVTPADNSALGSNVQTTVTGTTGKATNLTPGKQYKFTVAAVNHGKTSGSSNEISESTVPSGVTSFTVTQSTYIDDVQLSWTPEPGIQQSYTIKYGQQTLQKIPNNETGKAISGLTLGSSYTFSIVAVSNSKDSALTSKTYIVPACPEVTGFIVKSVTTSSISVEWNTITSLAGYTYTMAYTDKLSGSSTQTFLNIPSADTTKTISGLAAGHSYDISIQVTKGNAICSKTVISNTTNPLPPKSVALSTTSPQTTSTIALVWQPDADSTQDNYIIAVSAVNGNAVSSSVQISVIGATGTISNLTPGRMYEFVVKSVSDERKSVNSDKAVGSTIPDKAASIIVRQGSLLDSVAVEWAHGSGERQTYTVSYGSKAIPNIPSADTSLTIADLTLAQGYIFSITATSNGLTGDKKTVAHQMPDIPSVQGVAISTVTDTSISIQWTNVTSMTGFSYNVTYMEDKAGASAKNIQGITTTSQTINNLIPGQRYSMFVSVFKGGATGTGTVIHGNPKPLLPTNLAASTTSPPTSSHIVLTWQPAATSVQSGYNVTVTPAAGTTAVTGTTAVINGLTPGQLYKFVVNSVSHDQKSVGSSELSLSTVPAPVASLTVTQGTFIDSAKVEWTPGSGVRSTYTVTYGNKVISDIPSTQTSVTVNDLVLSNSYTFTVKAVSNGVSSSAISQSYDTPDLPLVTGFRVSSVTDTSITVSWAAFTSVTGHTYNVTYMSTTTGATTSTIQSINGTSKSITGCVPGQTYTLTVAVFKGGVTGPVSTLTNNTRPLAPTALKLSTSSSPTTSELHVSWLPATGSIQEGYNITVTPSDSSQIAITGSSGVISNLTPGKQYKVVVQARSVNRLSRNSNELTTSTVPSSALTVSAVQGPLLDSVTVSWTQGTGNRESYTVTYGAKTVPNIPSTQTSITINDLILSHAYTFSLHAVSNGLSSASKAADFTTPSLPQVSGFKVTAVTENTITLAWTGVTSLFGFSYNITYAEDISGSVVSVINDISTTSRQLTGLGAGHAYRITVVVFKRGITGPSTVLTNNTIPLPPNNLAVSSSSPSTTTTITLTWQSGAGSKQDSYTITVTANAALPSTVQNVVTGTGGVVSGLTPGMQYKFVVKARSGDRLSVSSNEVTANTSPSPVATISVKQGSVNDSVIVQWTHGTGSRDSYTVTYGTQTAPNIAATDTSVTLNELTLSKDYTFEILCVSNGVSSAKVMRDFRTPDVPVPTGLQTTATTSSITVSWSPVTSLTGHKYLLTYKQSSTTVTKTLADLSDTTATLTSLPDGTSYGIAVAVVKGNVTGTAASTSEITLPLPLQSLSVAKGSLDNSVVLSWTPSTGNRDSFTVTYGTEEVTGISSTQTSLNVNGLFMGEDYVFSIVAVSNGKNSVAVTQNHTTPAYPIAQNLQVDRATQTKIRVSWEKVTTLPDFTYTLNVTNLGNLITSIPDIGKDVALYWVEGLTAGTKYNVTLSVVNGQVKGKPAHTSDNTIPGPPLPITVNVSGVDTTHIKVAFPMKQDHTYEVKYELSSETGSNLQLTQCAGSPCVIDVAALGLPGTNIRVHIFAKLGSRTSPVSRRTGRSKPVAPQSLSEDKAYKSRTAVRFTWPEVSDSVSVFTHYQLNVYNGLTGEHNRTRNVLKGTHNASIGALIPGMLYNVTLCLKSAWEVSDPVNLAVRTIPYRVTDLTEDGATTTTLTFKWNPPAIGVLTKYRLLLAEKADSEATTTSLTHTFTGLTPGIIYTPAVVVQSGEDNSGQVTYSAQSTTIQSYTAPMAVTQQDSEITTTTITANWIPPTQGHLAAYNIALYPTDCTNTRKYFTRRLKFWTNFKFSSLQPGTIYCVEIGSYVGGISNRKVNNVQYKVTTVPNSPQSVTASNPTTNSLTLTWTAPSQSAAVSGYKVSVTKSSEYYPVQTHTVTNALTLDLVGLDEGQEYFIVVQAFVTDSDNNKDIYSAESSTTASTTGNPASVTVTTQTLGPLLAYETDTVVFTSAYNRLQSNSFYAREYWLPNNVRFLSSLCTYCRMGVTSAGYVTLRGRNWRFRHDMFLKRTGSKWSEAMSAFRKGNDMYTGQYVLAPFWTDTQFRLGSKSQVYFQRYLNTQTSVNAQRVLKYCNDAVATYTNYVGFTTTMAIVVTWENMVPSASSNNTGTSTFQLVMISGMTSDQRSMTFAVYLYGTVSWSIAQPVQIGYYLSTPKNQELKTHTEEAFSNVDSPFDKMTPYQIDTEVNQLTGKAGVYFYELSSYTASPSDDDLCVNWYNKEKQLTPVPYYNWHLNYTTPQYLEFFNDSYGVKISCPCDLAQVQADRKWRIDDHQRYILQSNKNCYLFNTPYWYTTKSCCYNSNGALITAEDGTGGYMYLFHPRYYYSKAYHFIHDDPYHDLCCHKTNNCDKFYEIRPSDNCASYKPPRYSWFQGDPHITTLDAHSYTFNGLGEYVLIQTTNSKFTLQARTEKIIDINGQTKEASVFTAIVGQDEGGDLVQVQLTDDRSGLVVNAAYTDITDSWFNNATDGDVLFDYDKVTITKVSNVSVDVNFESGFGILVTSASRQLSITVTAPAAFKDKTKGLLGVYNNYPSDDYTKRDGTTLNINSTEAQVFQYFGENWRTTEQESIFIYPSGKNHTDYAITSFQPIYFSQLQKQVTQTEWNQMSTTCNGNVYCLYDYVLTGDKELALLSLQADTTNQQTSSMFANNRPVITADKYFNVTLNQASNLTVVTTDSDGDTVSLSITFTKQSDGSDLSSQLTHIADVITWTPTTNEAVTMRLNAVDSRGGVAAEVQILIRFCECAAEHGLCVFEFIRTGQSTTSPFTYSDCMCNAGWTGTKCDEDINGCTDNPCGTNTVCTDVAAVNDTQLATGGAYTCGDCNTGYEKRSGRNSDCININECTQGTHNCDITNGVCTDTLGSFKCDCKSGYRLGNNGTTCVDINECTEGSSDCAHICINSVGSYRCECENGYQLNADLKACTMDPALRSQCTATGCDYCRGNTTTMECFCPDGYQLQADGKTCQDVNECQSASNNVCDLTVSSCNNTDGSYQCVCNTGYVLQADKRTCKACSTGYWGTNCANICRCKTGTTCSTTQGCTQCADSGFTGGNCDVDINECTTSNICGTGTSGCVNTDGSFKCTCVTGYEAVNNTHCQDIDDCNSQPCQNGAYCNNLVGPEYTCDCLTGYTGTNCELDVDECSSTPCLNGATCDNKVNQFRCVCPDNYKGKLCEMYIPPSTIANIPDVIKDNIVPDTIVDGNADDQSQSDFDAVIAEAGGVGIGIIAGAIVGVLALAAVVVGLLVYFLKKKASKAGSGSEKKKPLPDDDFYDDPGSYSKDAGSSNGYGEDGPILSVAPVFYKDAFYNEDASLQMQPKFPAQPKQPGKGGKGFDAFAAFKNLPKFPSQPKKGAQPSQPARVTQLVGLGNKGDSSTTAIPSVQE